LENPVKDNTTKWTWITWLQIFFVLATGSIISVLLRNFNNSLLLYLPSALGIALIHWFGPRMLPLSYLNGIFTLFLWGAPGGWERYLILATHEPLVAFLSWLLARKIIHNAQGFPSTSIFIRFTLLGIAIPDLANCFYTYHYSFVNGDLSKVFLLWLSDFITMYSIAIPLLHFMKASVGKSGLIHLSSANFNLLKSFKENARDLFLLGAFFLILSFIVDFNEYWFVYGICATIVAIRRGFELTLLTNFILFSLSYLVPLVLLYNNFKASSSQLLSVHLGMTTMFFVSSLIGRAVSDFRTKENELTLQKKQLEAANEQLNKTNSELDRFVYSVSHDISAPLKSIKGLVTLSRLDKEPSATQLYLDKIDASVQKLEGFIGEVLDHSRSSRKEIKIESIHLESAIHEILENLKYLENFNKISFHYDFQSQVIRSDRFLLKVALSNLISNSIKYQKRYFCKLPLKLGHSKVSFSVEKQK
jgi:signal transduction histidine kinase